MWILHQETRNDLKHIINDPLKREKREQSVELLKKTPNANLHESNGLPWVKTPIEYQSRKTQIQTAK